MRLHTLRRYQSMVVWGGLCAAGPVWAEPATVPVLAASVTQQVQAAPATQFPKGAAITLEQAWQLAQAQHPDLRAAAAEQEAAVELTRQAGALPNPEVSVLMEDTRAETRTTTWLWSQPIEGWGKRGARVEAAQWAERQAQSDVLARRAQVRARLHLAFYGALLAQERANLTVELARLATQARVAAFRRVTAGKAPPVEEVKAQVAEAQALAAQRTTQSEWRAAWQSLQQAIGGNGATAGRVEADLRHLPDTAYWHGVMAQEGRGLAVERAELDVSRQRAQVDVERTRVRPDVTLQLGVKREAQSGRNQTVVGLSLPLPMWDRNQGGVAAALKRVDKAEAELQGVQAASQAQAVEAFEQLQAAVEQARTQRDTVLPAARQAVDMAGKGYELGKFGILDVLDAQRTLFDAQYQTLSSTEQAFRAEARLIEMFGGVVAPRD